MNLVTQESPASTQEKAGPRFLIGIRVRDKGKSELYDPGTLQLRVGMTTIVESGKGQEIGVVASNKIVNFRKEESQSFKRVLRIANENDLQAEERREALEKRAKTLCLQKIDELNLPMNLSRVAHIPSANKTMFFFTAEGRVDFRQLIKELAANLRHRIEMKQVGVRDEARSISGYGICGESLCCSTFLEEFSPVTIRMAKDQGLALNPSKISGVCGRLMCCLQYEHQTYKELIRNLPKPGTRLNTPDGPGKVIKNEILEQNVVVRLDDESIMTYSWSELKETSQEKSPQ
ncbi:MAG: stage 0 sporulation protein [Nitrospinaceae bacterium]|nr:MAG: stage 0 sporulation protein [Nitrospinaceae bacterium]